MFPIQWFVFASDGIYTEENFRDFEISLLSALNFKLNISTPYDLIPLKEILPNIPAKHFKNA